MGNHFMNEVYRINNGTRKVGSCWWSLYRKDVPLGLNGSGVLVTPLLVSTALAFLHIQAPWIPFRRSQAGSQYEELAYLCTSVLWYLKPGFRFRLGCFSSSVVLVRQINSLRLELLICKARIIFLPCQIRWGLNEIITLVHSEQCPSHSRYLIYLLLYYF